MKFGALTAAFACLFASAVGIETNPANNPVRVHDVGYTVD